MNEQKTVEQGPRVSSRWFAFLAVSLIMINIASFMAIKNEDTLSTDAYTWVLYLGIALIYTALIIPFVSSVAQGGKGQHITTGMQRGESRYKTICKKYMLDHKGQILPHHSFLINADL